MSDDHAGGGPAPRDSSHLVRQLRRAMRAPPLAARGRPGDDDDASRADEHRGGADVIDGDTTSALGPGAGVPEVATARADAPDPVAGEETDQVGAPELAEGTPIDQVGAHELVEGTPIEVEEQEAPARDLTTRRERRGARAIWPVAALVFLVAAVPLLGWYGLHLVFSARGGRAVNTGNDPHALGYLALVTPTPTALLIQVDHQNQPVSLTLLSLTMQGNGGGAVLFIPLDTAVPVPSYGVDRLRTAYVRGGATVLASAVSQVLHIGFSQVITVDPAKLQALVAPVAPLAFDNPDTVTGDGKSFAAGQIQLSADQVPGYLTATRPGENDLERLNRHRQFWNAWLSAVGRSSSADVVPGEASTGLGHFVRTLASGTVNYEALPEQTTTESLNDGSQLFHADEASVAKLIALTVPFPVGDAGQRATVRVLNGANGDAVPPSILQTIVIGGGQITELGNARSFGLATTEIHYADPAQKAAADRLQFALGGKAKEVLDDAGEDTVQVTIVLGADLVDHPPAGLLPGPSGE